MTQTTINQKLKMTQEEYELFIFGAYARWCETLSGTSDRELQKIMANSGINKWYMTEYAKCEAEFLQLTERYEECSTITALDFKKCYAECTYRMFNIRPTVLLQIIKKSTIGSKIFNLN